ncbi:MAG: hypothetical protein ACPMAG_12045 [Limisphaerales bacterium]
MPQLKNLKRHQVMNQLAISLPLIVAGREKYEGNFNYALGR